MHTSTLKLVYVYSKLIHVLAKTGGHGLPKHVGGHCAYKLISIHLCAFVGTIIVYIFE